MGAGLRALPPYTHADAKQMFSVGSLSAGLKVKLLEMIANMNFALPCISDAEEIFEKCGADAFHSDPDRI